MNTRRIGYVTSRFPKLTETFILYEILGLERAGIQVDFYPLLRERARIRHPEAVSVMKRAHYLPFMSWHIIRSQVVLARRSPATYVRTFVAVLRGTFGTVNFLIGGIGIFPKVAHAARVMAEEGVTHVHCHFATHPALAGFIIHRLTGIRYSFTAQGSDLHVDRRMLCEKVAEAAFVVAISNYNKDVILQECGEVAEGKIRVIRSGIDTSFFRPRRDGRAEGSFRIVCVGTLHEVKGQAYLIEACRLLVEAGVDVTCELIGDGPDRETLARRIDEAGLQERVRFAGPRTRIEVAESLATADALAVPSVPTKAGKREGIPVVLMEALACRLPVVASAISGIPELVEHERTGLLVPPRDPAALAQALRDLHGDGALRRRLGAAGRDKVLREYDAYANAARLAREIAEVEEIHREKSLAAR